MIDTHSHLYDNQFDNDRAEVISRAKAASIDKIILPAVDSKSHDALLSTLDQYSGYCYGAMGVHPTSVNDNDNWEQELEIAEQLITKHRQMFVAVGEAGLDLYWSKDFLDRQIVALEFQIELAKKLELPIILHVRDAWDEILPIIRAHKETLRGVFHSFSGALEHFREIEAMGNFAVGISGPITYKNSKLREVLKHVPLCKIVLETDSPYLPPVPHRGHRNESSYLYLVARSVAQAKECDVETVQKITSDNANSIFFI